MINSSAPTVGQAAYIVGEYRNLKVSVLRITAKGKIVVSTGGDATATFDMEVNRGTNGHSEYRPSSIFARDYRQLRFDIAEVDAAAAKKVRQYAAADALNAVTEDAPKVGRAWNKDYLLSAVAALEAKLAAARALVESI